MITLDGKTLTLKKLVRIALNSKKVAISPLNKKGIDDARNYIMEVVKGKKPIYGINTGFGHLANVMIDENKLEQLQTNLLMSHACGVGKALDKHYVRAMMALRINALIQGFSGISYETINQMVLLLNNDIIPVVYEKGSLGASGDLALLSHMSLPLLGLGEVIYQNKIMSAKKAYLMAGLKPLEKLNPKEGLSLINGTQAMSAVGGLNLVLAFKLLNLANLSLSLTMEALGSSATVFDEKVHLLRKQSGQIRVAKHIKTLLNGSLNTTTNTAPKIQDAYSLRCSPQVHGACLGVLWHTKEIVTNEFNAVTDNPLVFAKTQEIISAGNFHGEPLALAFDYLAMAISELASISERRIERLVNPQLNGGLPPFLTENSGLNSGFMIIQYTAAALVSENKVLSHPASVDSIPSSANQEDHVSMGSISALKLKEINANTRKVIALEILTALQAADLKGTSGYGIITKRAYNLIRKHIPFIPNDELMYPHIQKIESLLEDDAFYQALFEGVDLIE